MNFTQLDQYGNVLGSGSSGAGLPSRSVIPLGTFWNSSVTANQYNNTYIGTINANGNTNGATGFAYKFERAGAITAWQLQQNGPVTGTNYMQPGKNGSVLDTLNFGTSNSGTIPPPLTYPNSKYVFAAGDVLTCNVMNTVAGNTQVEAYATIEWLS